MIIYPAIDIKGGRCVRLLRGDMNADTVYGDDPAAQAHEWARAGFSWVHVVDLDGAVQGTPVNADAVRAIVESVDIPVQLGGGIRAYDDARRWLETGISRVIIGTAAVRDPELVCRLCNDFPDQIAVGIDARGGRVAVSGWGETTDMQATDLARHFADAGVCALIYTDIDRDGTQQGVNIESTAALARATSIPVIASGGIGSLADLRTVAAAGLPGVIVGRALYEKTVTPQDALSIAGAL